MKTKLLLAAAAMMQTARAQFATATWFSQEGCVLPFRTQVTLEAPLCQTVPEATEGGYKVTCNADNTGGTFSVCGTNQCTDGQCGVAVPFGNGQCLPNPAQFGARSVVFNCAAEVPPAAPVTPAAGDMAITWYEQPGCEPSHRTTVVGPQDLCHTVPNGAQGGYKVECLEDGTGGVFRVCSDNTCSTCSVNTPFLNANGGNDRCIPNPPVFGAASVAFQCGPRVPGGGGGGGGGGGNGGGGNGGGGGGQPTNGELFRIRWYEADGCNGAATADNANNNNQQQQVRRLQAATTATAGGGGGGGGASSTNHRTVVVGFDGLCQRVPDSNFGYTVACDPDRQGGLLSFCQTATCSQCQFATRFRNNQCIANNPIYGSRSYDVNCDNTAVGNVSPRSDDVAIQWFASADCTAVNTPTTVVTAARDICHLVPNATDPTGFGGYAVFCDPAGNGGEFQVCSSSTCGTCNVRTPFTNGQCLPNPPVTGSSSVRFSCGVVTAAGNPTNALPNNPFTGGAGGGSGGGGSGAGGSTTTSGSVGVTAGAAAAAGLVGGIIAGGAHGGDL